MTHVYTKSDVIELKDVVAKLRKLQEKIEDDEVAYSIINEAMYQVEEIIDNAEDLIYGVNENAEDFCHATTKGE